MVKVATLSKSDPGLPLDNWVSSSAGRRLVDSHCASRTWAQEVAWKKKPCALESSLGLAQHVRHSSLPGPTSGKWVQNLMVSCDVHGLALHTVGMLQVSASTHCSPCMPLSVAPALSRFRLFSVPLLGFSYL